MTRGKFASLIISSIWRAPRRDRWNNLPGPFGARERSGFQLVRVPPHLRQRRREECDQGCVAGDRKPCENSWDIRRGKIINARPRASASASVAVAILSRGPHGIFYSRVSRATRFLLNRRPESRYRRCIRCRDGRYSELIGKIEMCHGPRIENCC